MEIENQLVPLNRELVNADHLEKVVNTNGHCMIESNLSNIDKRKSDPDSTDKIEDIKTKKKVNICTDNSVSNEMRRYSETSESCDKSASSTSNEKCLTMTGTIKRGKKAGQSLDVRLNISREELEIMEANIAAKKQQKQKSCSMNSGLHIVIFTVICFPVAFIISALYSFYMGTITWYNIFTYVTDKTNLVYKLFISPILILLYPFLIIFFTCGLGFYAAIVQLSWSISNWQKDICDWEKGFYGWFCSVIKLEECSPYEVVVLTDIKVTSDQEKCNSQDSILT